jgi:carbon-monoxide dehydrogenase medium subunit
MKAFDYVRPSSFEEACRLLSRSGGQSKVIAGGTDLLVQIRQGKLNPEAVISLRDIQELSRISFNPDHGVTIGAMTTLDIVESSKEILENFGSVAEAAGQIGSAQVRSRATLGGNLCHAAPSGDMAPSLIAYGATVVISDGNKDQTIPLEDFFTGPGRTVLKEAELMREIHIPLPPRPNFGTYLKASRSIMDLAMVGVAMLAVFESDGETCRDLRLVLGAAAPTPFRASEAENMAIGHKFEDELIDKVSQMASDEARPISDVRSTADHRRSLIKVMVRRALVAARSWARKGEGR